MCCFAYGEPYVSHKTMVGSTSNFSNVYEVVYDNSNPYMDIVMDAIRMNQGYVSQYPIVDAEPNAKAAMFFFISFERLRRIIMR